MASKNNKVLYVGFTNNIIRRTKEHKDRINKGFTYRYNVDKLVYYEVFGYVEDAILREKRLKKWNREWKIQLIEENNPIWDDLSLDW
ncbi:GIY-YIG nuclease family protein [Flavobacterium jejuense]|uniref:GIY-YIG nuclease family protein n=2 Tax=Flavobacterium jejuense TaxID=1544455 RepID=A0ABX0IUB5_9FLAO|nr:GIY-YIG nuclease family protein [Flavobacterium jejuense]